MLRHSHQRRERNRVDRFPIASFRPPIASLYFSFYPANIALPRQMSARTPFLLSVPQQRFFALANILPSVIRKVIRRIKFSTMQRRIHPGFSFLLEL